MKWKNEYIVGLTWNNVPFILAMTLIVSEETDAQAILNKAIKLSSQHICKVAKINKVEPKDLRFNMINLVKTMLITEEDADKFLNQQDVATVL